MTIEQELEFLICFQQTHGNAKVVEWLPTVENTLLRDFLQNLTGYSRYHEDRISEIKDKYEAEIEDLEIERDNSDSDAEHYRNLVFELEDEIEQLQNELSDLKND